MREQRSRGDEPHLSKRIDQLIQQIDSALGGDEGLDARAPAANRDGHVTELAVAPLG